jgi:Pectate lyase superfamily protein
MWMKFVSVCIAALTLLASTAFASTSAMQSAPSDPRAVTVKGKGDGKTDDTDAIQRALDQASEHGGVVFLPSGRYKISRSLLIWPAVRLYGTGRSRPVLFLADNTPGFQKGVGSMVVFTGAPRGVIAHNDMGRVEVTRVPFPPPTIVPFDPKVADANPNTFYSGLSNVDIQIGAGNPAATGVRFRVAQHSFLSNMDFELGSGFAGLYQVGNVVHNLHFHGGRYGIVSEKTSPAWQFTAVDCTFDSQRSAAIREHEVDLTLANVAIRNVPVGIDIDRGYGDSMFGKDVRFENVAQAAIVISNENNVFTQIGFANALARNTPVFAKFRDSGKTVNGKGSAYRVSSFSYGLTVPAVGQLGHFETQADVEPVGSWPAAKPLAIRPLPPVSEWANAHDLGVVGDGEADDTAALQRAIDSHRVVYLPLGAYKVSDTIHLGRRSFWLTGRRIIRAWALRRR